MQTMHIETSIANEAEELKCVYYSAHPSGYRINSLARSGVSRVSSSHSYIHNPRHSSSFIKGSAFPPKKVLFLATARGTRRGDNVNRNVPVRPLAAYFIIHNKIYQSPDVYTVLSNRLVRPISNSFTCLIDMVPLVNYLTFTANVTRHVAHIQTRFHSQDRFLLDSRR